jgi:hypothetical protein
MASLNDWTKKFGHSVLQNLVSYLLTHNTATQSFTVDSNANDVETDNAGLVFISGIPYVTAADTAYDQWGITLCGLGCVNLLHHDGNCV